jgi:biopolymer transport protein ExbD
MRRFSQRSSLVTLNEINITPLLDLAFVLLIIFVITTPLLEKGLELKLPTADGQNDKPIRKEDVSTVEITAQGAYALKGRTMKLEQVLKELAADSKLNPNMVVYIRADENSRTKELAALIGGCQQNKITRYSLRTQPPGRR